MRIISWNVNGIRAAAKKGFLPWLMNSEATIVGLQEVRAVAEQIPDEVREPEGWNTHFVAGKKLGYSGVCIFSKLPIDSIATSLDVPEFDDEGRVQMAEFGSLLIANVYFPNGNGKDHDNSRIPFKLDFYKRLFEVLEDQRAKGRPILVMGDFNTAHQEIDLARPKENQKTSGFCPEEREELDRWLRGGYVDTFRHFNKDPGNYTWWNLRTAARARNVGWRIDYVLASESAMPLIKDAFIWQHVQGSDHCPVGVVIDKALIS